MSPLFKRKDPVEKRVEKLLAWAEEEMARGRTRNDVWQELLSSDGKIPPLVELQARSQAASIINGVFLERNQRGSQYEDEGRLADAVREYQANIRDGFVGTHPYERLRIIYAKHKDYQSALNVCEAYLRMSQNPGKKRERFEKWAEKYKAKLAEQQ